MPKSTEPEPLAPIVGRVLRDMLAVNHPRARTASHVRPANEAAVMELERHLLELALDPAPRIVPWSRGVDRRGRPVWLRPRRVDGAVIIEMQEAA